MEPMPTMVHQPRSTRLGRVRPHATAASSRWATSSAWQAQLEEVRRRRFERGGGHAGLAKPQQVLGKTGLQVMTALLEGELPHPYMADTFDCELIEVGEGLAVFQATPQLK